MSLLDRFSEEDIRKNTFAYNAVMKEGEPDGWDSPTKIQNFLDLIGIASLTNVPIEGSSCLDVGCGTGDFAPFLRNRRVQRYLGIDIYQPAIEKARAKYNEEFINQDFLTFTTKERFDYAFLSGAITVKIDSDHHALVRAMAAKMWQLTKVGFGINFLLPSNQGDRIFELVTYATEEIERLCAEVTPGSVIKQTERLDTYGIVFAFRPQSISS